MLRSMPGREAGKVRWFVKTEFPSMALPMFGWPEPDTGLPKMAIPPARLDLTLLPVPGVVPPMRLKDTPGSLACAGPKGAPRPLRKTMPRARFPIVTSLAWMMLPWAPLSSAMPSA